MYYLTLDEGGYLVGYAVAEAMPGEVIDMPAVEHLDEAAMRDAKYFVSHRWDGEKLVLDKQRLARLELEEKENLAKEEKAAIRAEIMQEVHTALIAAQINTLDVDDDTALRWRVLYPEWKTGTQYETGDKVQYKDKLYRCLQGHTAQENWAPDLAASLWTEICETHAGTTEDPIPYDGNMALESGKYYTQGGVIYRCTRDTVNPVYNPLAQLVGLYVEVIL